MRSEAVVAELCGLNPFSVSLTVHQDCYTKLTANASTAGIASSILTMLNWICGRRWMHGRMFWFFFFLLYEQQTSRPWSS